MATGLIGTSTATATTGTVTGSTISYTCPGSGVRYAVVSVTASVSAIAGGGGYTVSAHAGILNCFHRTGSTGSDGAGASDSASYSVVLGPGQTWSGYAEAVYGGGGGSGEVRANLQASVLEVV